LFFSISSLPAIPSLVLIAFFDQGCLVPPEQPFPKSLTPPPPKNTLFQRVCFPLSPLFVVLGPVLHPFQLSFSPLLFLWRWHLTFLTTSTYFNVFRPPSLFCWKPRLLMLLPHHPGFTLFFSCYRRSRTRVDGPFFSLD